MRIFLYVAFFFVGMVAGGATGGSSSLLLGGIIGLGIFWLIDRSGRSMREVQSEDGGESLEDLRREVRQLKHDVARLAGKVATLSGESSVATADNAPGDAIPAPIAHAASFEPADSAIAEPSALGDEGSPRPVEDHADSVPPVEALPTDESPAEPEAGFRPLGVLKTWLFGGNALVRVGVVVLFFGLAFLVKFAAEHAVLPIEARYVGIGIGALITLVLGWRLRVSRPEYAMALQGLGVASLYLVTFAAFRIHGLLPGGLTLVILVATCVLSAALAVLQNARSMAVIGICGGFLAPVLASTGGGNHVILFSYYALLNVGIVGIAWFKAWRPLNVLGFLLTFGIGSLWASRNYRDELFGSTEPFLILFFGLYLVVSLLYAARRKMELSRHAVEIAGERIDYVDGTLVFGNPLAAFGLQYLMVEDIQYGAAFSALGLGMIYLPLATMLYRRGRDDFRLLVESFLALGVIFASLAIPLGLDTRWTSAAWAAEGAGIFWVGLRQQRPAARAFALLLQFGSAVSLLLSLEQPGVQNLLGLVPVFDGSVLGPVFVGLAAMLTAGLIRRGPQMVSQSESTLEPLIMVIGLGFLNLAFPVFLDASWTGLALAVSGVVTVWIAARFGHVAAMGFGLAVQIPGGLMFGSSTSVATSVALLNRFWLGSVVVSGAGLASGWRVGKTGGPIARMSMLALIWGLLWWWGAGEQEISTHVASEFVLAGLIGFATVTSVLFAFGGRRAAWPAAEAASMLLMPALLLLAFSALDQKSHPGADGGWLGWPLAIATTWWVLHRQEDGLLRRLIGAGHAFTLLLATALATWQSWWWFHELGDAGSAWPLLGWALAPIAVIGLLNSAFLRSRWPLAVFPRAYDLAAIPVVAGLWLWVLFANAVNDGRASPLPYVPIANPIDLATAGTLIAILAWLRHWHGSSGMNRIARTLLAITGFYWLNGVLLRTLHHWAGVPFDFDAMMHSTLVQASLSLFWATIALALMLFATRTRLRNLWLTGGGLLASVVLKLFLVDLSRVGTIERIVSFIGVGILLLVIGYFSPVPPKREEQT
jgi:uncharacterized membrane protein